MILSLKNQRVYIIVLCIKRVFIYTYGWFILRFDRKQQNSVKQLSFIKKLIKKQKETEKIIQNKGKFIIFRENLELIFQN